MRLHEGKETMEKSEDSGDSCLLWCLVFVLVLANCGVSSCVRELRQQVHDLRSDVNFLLQIDSEQAVKEKAELSD